MSKGDDWTENAYGLEGDRVFSEPESGYTSLCLSNQEFARELGRRTKEAAIQLINFMQQAGKDPALNVVRYQLIKSGTSVAANYRAACRARSKKEWYGKMCIVVEECDETVFWLEILLESNLPVEEQAIRTLGKEYHSLLQLFAKARAHAKSKMNSHRYKAINVRDSDMKTRDLVTIDLETTGHGEIRCRVKRKANNHYPGAKRGAGAARTALTH